MFEIKVSEEQAINEVNALLDKKRMFPKDRERRKAAIDAVIDGVMYGLVSIETDGSISQTLDVAVGTIDVLKWKSHIAAETMNRALSQAKAENQVSRNMVYITTYTDSLTATINKMEPNDRNICDSIAFFLQ